MTGYGDHRVNIYNARKLSEGSLNREGFVLRHSVSSVSDFYNANEVREVYYREVEAFLARLTGARVVTAFAHTWRCTEDGRQRDASIQTPLKLVHNDYTATSGPSRVREILGQSADTLMRCPFSIINVWRPINRVVERAPLAICDAQSVAAADRVALPFNDPIGRQIKLYCLTFNSRQRWYYFPMMTHTEILLFKTFDSLDDGRARYTFHSAFNDPNTSSSSPARESLEVRAVVV